MDCREVAELLPDYLQRSLPSEKADALESHLRLCPTCRDEIELWNRLGSISAGEPSLTSRIRFDTMIEAYRMGDRERSSRRAWVAHLLTPRFVQLEGTVALVVVGFLLGFYVGRDGSNANELASLHRELSNTRQLVALSLLKHDSASDRLQGVTWSTSLERPNPDVLNALLYTLCYDNSVDVRLAALDALRRYNDQTLVRTGVGDSLSHQHSPMVQIALVDFLVDSRDRSAIDKLRNFKGNPNLLPVVRERVERGIDELSRG